MASSKHSLASRRAQAARLAEDVRLQPSASDGRRNGAGGPEPAADSLAPFHPESILATPLAPLSLSLQPARPAKSRATEPAPVSASPVSPYAAIRAQPPLSPLRGSPTQYTTQTPQSQLAGPKSLVTRCRPPVTGTAAAGPLGHPGALPGTLAGAERGRELEGRGGSKAGTQARALLKGQGHDNPPSPAGRGHAAGAPRVRGLFDTGTMAEHISTALSRGLTRDWSAPPPAHIPTSPGHSPGMPSGMPSGASSPRSGVPDGVPSSLTGSVTGAVRNTTGAVMDSAASHLPAVSRLEELIPWAAEKERAKQRGGKPQNQQRTGSRGSDTSPGPSKQAPKAPFPLGLRVFPCHSGALPRCNVAPGCASAAPFWAVQEDYREVEISASRNLSPKVTLVTEARATRLAVGDLRVRIQRIGSLPRRDHKGATLLRQLPNTVTGPASLSHTTKSAVVDGTGTNGTAGNPIESALIATQDSLQDAAQAAVTSSDFHSSSPYPLSAPSHFSPSPEVPCHLSASLLTDLRHRASLSLLACLGSVGANSLSLLLSSSSHRPLRGWHTRGIQRHATASGRGTAGLTLPAEQQAGREGALVSTTAALASSHVVARRTRLCTRLTMELGATQATGQGYSQGGTGMPAAASPGFARPVGAPKVFLQALHRVNPTTAVSASVSYNLGGSADVGLIVSRVGRGSNETAPGAKVGPLARAGAGAGRRGGEAGARKLWEALGFGAKAYVSTRGVFSVSFNVSAGNSGARGANAQEQGKLVC